MPNWRIFDSPQPYLPILDEMSAYVRALQGGTADEAIWILSHQAVYTGGTSASDSDILSASSIPFVETGRGGQWTYHDEGMRIVYPLLDLNRRKQDVRLYVHTLEAWIIDILGCFSVKGERRDGLPGVWVRDHDADGMPRFNKIAALGVRVSKWVSAHGFSINLSPDLSAFDAIVPCGVTDAGTTSLTELGHIISDTELDMAIKDCFITHFGKDGVMGPQN